MAKSGKSGLRIKTEKEVQQEADAESTETRDSSKHSQLFKERALEIGTWRIEEAAKKRKLPTQAEIALHFGLDRRQVSRYIKYLSEWTNFNEELRSMLASALMMFITRAALKGNGNDFKVIFQIVERFDFSTTIRTPDMAGSPGEAIMPALISSDENVRNAEKAYWEAVYNSKASKRLAMNGHMNGQQHDNQQVGDGETLLQTDERPSLNGHSNGFHANGHNGHNGQNGKIEEGNG